MKVFLFILDGCSVTQFTEANKPFLSELMEAGKYSSTCKAIIPTATYTGHASIITGTYPEKHGMVGNQFFDRQNQCIRNFDEFNPNEHIESPTIFELLPFPSCAICEPITKGASLIVEKKIFDQMPLETQNKSIFNQVINSFRPDIQFYMVNFQGVDGFGESKGPNAKEYLRCLEEVDELLFEIRNRIQSEFVFIVTADHGMTTVKKNINLEEKLKKEGFQVRCTASHRCSHIYADSNLEGLEKHLLGLRFIDKVFNVNKIEKAHLKHERTGDFVVFAKKGFEFGEKKLKGSHGGITQDEILVPLLIYASNEKLIDKISLDSIKLIDLCPSILNLFDIKSNIPFQGKSFFQSN